MGKLILVTAERNGGKSSEMWKLYRSCLERGEAPGGFITELKEDKSSYNLIDLLSGNKLLMADDGPGEAAEIWSIPGSKYHFPRATFKKVFRRIEENLDREILFIDEAGKLEFAGKGIAPVLHMLRKRYKGTLIIAVRQSNVKMFLERFPFRASALEIHPVPPSKTGRS